MVIRTKTTVQFKNMILILLLHVGQLKRIAFELGSKIINILGDADMERKKIP